MIDEHAKRRLHEELREVREAVLWKLDGLSDHDIRRPLTATGTNLLGLVKHLATWEARYLGEVFDRPFPEPLRRWQDSDGSDLWATEHETREEVVAFYRRVWAHADATVDALPIDAPGSVPWWQPHPDVKLFDILVHVLGETQRHAGHADILREQLDGATGTSAEYAREADLAERRARYARIEQAAARAAAAAEGAEGAATAEGAGGAGATA